MNQLNVRLTQAEQGTHWQKSLDEWKMRIVEMENRVALLVNENERLAQMRSQLQTQLGGAEAKARDIERAKNAEIDELRINLQQAREQRGETQR